MQKELEIIKPTEKSIESMIYDIRGQKIMLDFDLANIYSYTTKAFNQQVKNNIDRFESDFCFRLTMGEFKTILKSKKLTSSWGGRRKLPLAFTEQGIYMLMTVPRGELAAKQSKALIRLFKKMKDYIVEKEKPLNLSEIIKITDKVYQHDRDIHEIKSHLEVVMNEFIDPTSCRHFFLFNNQRIEADIAYQQIYSLAKYSIYVIDDYIDIKTFQLLKACRPNINLIIFSDNKAKNKLTRQYLDDFIKDNNIALSLRKTNGLSHDRYIFIDYGTKNERLFHSGSSSKDAGNRATTITTIEDSNIYHPFIDRLLSNENLTLIDD